VINKGVVFSNLKKRMLFLVDETCIFL